MIVSPIGIAINETCLKSSASLLRLEFRPAIHHFHQVQCCQAASRGQKNEVIALNLSMIRDNQRRAGSRWLETDKKRSFTHMSYPLPVGSCA
jgi:hypothetical protein